MRTINQLLVTTKFKLNFVSLENELCLAHMRIKGFKRSFHKLQKFRLTWLVQIPKVVYNTSTILKSKPLALSLIYSLQVHHQTFSNFLNYFFKSGTTFTLIIPGVCSQTFFQRVFRVRVLHSVNVTLHVLKLISLLDFTKCCERSADS